MKNKKRARELMKRTIKDSQTDSRIIALHFDLQKVMDDDHPAIS